MVSKFRTMVSNVQLEVEVAAAAPSTAVALAASGASSELGSLLIISKLAVEKRKKTWHIIMLCCDRTINKNSSTLVQRFEKLSSRKAILYFDTQNMIW